MTRIGGGGIMRSRLVMVIGVVALTATLAGCAWFPGGIPPTASPATVASAGCATATPRTPGLVNMNITSDGVARTYLRRIPQGYDAVNPIPIVFDFHGYEEGAQVQVIMSEWGPVADAHKFVVIYPQGLGSPVRWDTALGSADLSYFGHLLDQVESDLCVDQRRVFVEGLSMGAFMSSSIACQFSDRVAAVGLVAGIRDPAGCAPTRAVPAVAFHGTADTFVPFPPIPGIVAAWAGRNHCAAKSSEVSIASDVNLVRYLCPLGAEVGLYRIEGGGHAWPGSAFSRQIAAVVGFTTFSIHATDIMWDFFTRHPLPLASS
jgi:polyhydroxybutyrate depolymerase